jgi:hypothetical protein
MRGRIVALAAGLALGLTACGGTPASERVRQAAPSPVAQMKGSGPFATWAAIVVAADDRANTGNFTEAFDNARRDVAAALEDLGFAPGRIAQFSVNPELYPDQRVQKASYSRITASLRRLTQGTGRAGESGGCLLYFTSHGTEEEGIVLGAGTMSPANLEMLADRHCAAKPTIVVVSACHSGTFLDGALAQPNRFVLTAARADRSSFGCAEDAVYPYFDTCFLAELPGATDWIDLGQRTRRCVARREAATGMAPPSEPQVFIGAAIAPLLESAAFAGP